MARLLIKSDGFRNRAIDLRLGPNRIGRNSDNDFQIEHPTVSGWHCEILLAGEEVLVRDLGSTNGTFIAGQPIHEARIFAGQTLCLGDVELLMESTEAAVAIPKIELPAPVRPIVLDDGSVLCQRHPETVVTHRCTNCGELLCEACLHRLRRRGGKVLMLCPRCSHICESLSVEKKKKKRKLKNIVEFFRSTVKLPFIHPRKDDD